MRFFNKSIFGYALFLILIINYQGVFAQQQPHFTEYVYNIMNINPAYTGTDASFEAYIIHRTQWSGLDGAPSTQVVGIQGALENNIGIGLNILNDKIGPSNETVIKANVSYTIKASATINLALGINVGTSLLSVNYSDGSYYNPGDPMFKENVSNMISPYIGAGGYLFSEKWYFGLSVPNFAKSTTFNNNNEIVVPNMVHYYLMSGYIFNLSNNLKFKPSVLAKVVAGAPVSVDLSANFLINEKFILGAGYRYNDAVNILAGFQVSKSILIGYAYDYNLTNLQKYNQGSHDLVLRYRFVGKQKNTISPRFF